MGLFDEKVALVTGSGRGIGRRIAIHLAEQGADVVVNFFRNRKPAEQTAEAIRQLGRRAFVVKANVGDMDQFAGLFQALDAEFGRLDIYIHNAASGFLFANLSQKKSVRNTGPKCGWWGNSGHDVSRGGAGV